MKLALLSQYSMLAVTGVYLLSNVLPITHQTKGAFEGAEEVIWRFSNGSF